MALDIARIRELIKGFRFSELFTELGWDNYRHELPIEVDGTTYKLVGLAEKRGVVVLFCSVPKGTSFPDHAIRRLIEHRVRQLVHEHVIVFSDADRTVQIWQWVRRAPGKPAAVRERAVHPDQSVEAVAQILARVVFELTEEDGLLQPHVVGRVAQAFDIERVTARFYERFREEHQRFLAFIKGITAMADREWYASLMLNRLMFVYFIQRKGFLDRDPQYLRNRLVMLRERNGREKFLSFYRYFLLKLFHDGLGARAPRKPELDALLGTVPYLNGGLFEVHELERRHPDIDIPDDAFERIFDFFDEYQWHLDERAAHAGNEINPDVLGFIFEKYINQKQMGAYYTKEDITSYIASNSIVPLLLDRLAEQAPQTFGAGGTAWRLLQQDRDRYIPRAALKGVEQELPDDIVEGKSDPRECRRWTLQASNDLGNPLETWREVVARRERVAEVRRRLGNGKLGSADDLIALNLDLLQFILDAVGTATEPQSVRAAYRALTSIVVLDPACGSGAFLFAALAILQPIHDACLDRMESFIDDAKRDAAASEAFADFEAILARAAKHPNRSYFVLKTIVLQNLYGVDIMEEATEICKLRLFLKLAAQVDRFDELEPLPDLDFNVRAGNSLVGLSTLGDIERAVRGGTQRKLDLDTDMPRLQAAAERADAAFLRFRELQTEEQGPAVTAAKQDLKQELSKVREELDRYLARDYGVDIRSRAAIEAWRAKHQPFHWFVEFYSIVKRGGFDAVIGNPPYVELKDVQDQYKVQGFVTQECGDLYACFMERSYSLLRASGRLGLIVPISIFGVDGFEKVQKLTLASLSAVWVSCFSNRPAQLFDGAQKRLTIVLGRRQSTVTQAQRLFTTSYIRWKKEERDALFATRINYVEHEKAFRVFPASLEKLGSVREASIFSKLIASRGELGWSLATDASGPPVYYTRKFGYFLLFLDRAPRVIEIKTNKPCAPSELKELRFRSNVSAQAAIAILSSTTFFWFWGVLSDCRNLNRRDLLRFPLDIEQAPAALRKSLAALGARYIRELQKGATWMQKSGKKLETFDYAACKPIIDEIDEVLAKHFGLDDAEFEFLINYDLKYRVSQENDEEEVPQPLPKVKRSEPQALEIISIDDARAKREAFKTLLPLYSIKAAAGYFGAGEAVEPEGWVRVGKRKLDDLMFVARAVGSSMEPKIRDGDFLVFRREPGGSRNGRIVLAQYRGTSDPETGGAFTVKKYSSEKKKDRESGWRHTKVVLSPLNDEFKPIVIPAEAAEEVRIIAELVDVLPRSSS